MFKILALLFFALALANCAHLSKRPQMKVQDQATAAKNDVDQGDEDVYDPEDEKPIVVGKEMPKVEDLADNEADIKYLPSEMNENVQKWINYFQGKGRKHMVRYLSRSTRYIPKMKEILHKHGLPEDLVYVALIESGFNANALSHARASGYWQFIRGTARRYDLRIDYYVDERNDFIESTEAAAQYLKALHNLFGSWYLAIASYNVGENRVKGLIMKYYTRDFWEMARMKKLPKETINYVPKFLAARLIGKHPEKYGFTDVEYMKPLDYQEVYIDKAVSLPTLAQQLGMDYEELRGLNNAYKRGIVPKYGDRVMIRVPTQLDKAQVMAALERSSTNVAVSQAIAFDDSTYTRYRVRNGDTLSTIARKFKVSMGALIEMNDLSKRSMIRAGKTLRIPVGGGNKRATASDKKTSLNSKSVKLRAIAQAQKSHRAPASAKKKYHVVRRGETLLNIASKYNVSLSQLLNTNKLQKREKILIGSRLAIPFNN